MCSKRPFGDGVGMRTHELYCYFIDRHIRPGIGMSREVIDFKKQLHEGKQFEGTFLITCQRFEYYSTSTELFASFDARFGLRGGVIQGRVEVFKRICEIAAGLKSQLIGETYILEQVRGAFASTFDPLMQQVAMDALEEARRIRQNASFYAKNDYPNIADYVFNRMRENDRTSVSLLMVVGTGHFGRSLGCVYSELGYGDVAIISRRLKQAKKNHKKNTVRNDREKALEGRFWSVDALPGKLTGHAFHCILATDSVESDYREKLRRLINQSLCKGVLDLCNPPIFSRGELPEQQYIDTSHPWCQILVQLSNEAVAPKVPDVREAVAAAAEAYRLTAVRVPTESSERGDRTTDSEAIPTPPSE